MNQPTTAITVFEGHIDDPKINTDFWERARKSDPSTWDLSHLNVLEEKGKACIRIEDMSKIVHETVSTVANELMYITSAYNDTRNEFYYFTDVIPEEHARRIARLNRDMCLRYVMVKCSEPNVDVMLRFAEAFDKVESAIAAKRVLPEVAEEFNQRTFAPVVSEPTPEPEQVQAEPIEQDDYIDYGDSEVRVWARDGQPVTSSRNIAEAFGKNHKDVIRRIRAILDESPDRDFNQRNFTPVEFTDAKGERRPAYRMARDGAMLVIMSFHGTKAMAVKVAYIRRFSEMEKALAKLHRAQVVKEIAPSFEVQHALQCAQKPANPNRYLIPTELGMLVGLEPWEVNQRLKFLGYQYHTDFGWRLTTKGKALGAVCVNTGKRDDEGNAILQIKWPAYVTEVL